MFTIHNVFGRIVDGFLSGVGFVFAIITVPLVIIHPIPAAIPITLLGAWFSRHRISAFQQGVDEPVSPPQEIGTR